MGRLQVLIGAAVVVAVMGGYMKYQSVQIKNLRVNEALLETAIESKDAVIAANAVSAHESRLRHTTLDHSNNSAVREQRTANTSFKEGLKNETLADVTRGTSITRHFAARFAELRAITRNNNTAGN